MPLSRIEMVTTTAYRIQIKAHVKQYNRTFVPRLRHSVHKHQKDWDTLPQLLNYAYNAQTHRTAGAPPLNVISKFKKAFSALVDRLAGQANYVQRALSSLHCSSWLRQQSPLTNVAVSRGLYMAEQHYKRDIGKDVPQEWTFNIRHYVLVNPSQQDAPASDASEKFWIPDTIGCGNERLDDIKYVHSVEHHNNRGHTETRLHQPYLAVTHME